MSSEYNDFDGLVVRNRLVVRNTFLDYSDGLQGAEDGEEPIGRRQRATSDLTDTKLPWKVPLSDQADQITRRRLGSNTDELTSPVGVESGLGTVEEEEELTSRTRTSGSSRAAGARRSRAEEFDPGAPPIGGLPMPGFFPGAGPFGPHGAIPMLPSFPTPWGYHPTSPQWAHASLSMLGYPGLMAPNAPGLPQSAASSGRATASDMAHREPQLAAPAQNERKANRHERGSKKSGGGGGGGGGDRQQGGGGGGGSAKAKAKAQAQAQSHAEPSEPKVRAAPNAPPPQPPGEPTTVMLRNIPNRYTSGSLLVLLDERGFQACYDFVYLPMDFQNGVNLGYAFVNLLRHSDAIRFKEVFQGFQDWRFDSAKVSEVSWAHPHQGLAEHVERYRNSPVMHPSMPDEYKPMMFQSGKRVQFPPPTRVIKAPKLRLGRDRPRDSAGPEESSREGS